MKQFMTEALPDTSRSEDAGGGRGAKRSAWKGEPAFFVLLLFFLPTLLSGCGRGAGEVMSLEENVTQKETESTEASAEEAGTDSAAVAGGAEETGTDSAAAADGGAEETGAAMAVYVCGAVTSPGVYQVTEDMRLIDAVNLAGGFAEDADQAYWNLAQKLADGAMYYIPTVSESADADFVLNTGEENGEESGAADGRAEGSDSADSGSGGTDGLISINTATKEELMTLPGIGETKAAAIITYRETNGAFTSTEEITNVSGIGESTYEKLKDYICL